MTTDSSIIRLYIRAVAFVLALTASTKFLAVLQERPFLAHESPLLTALSKRQLLALAGLVEFLAAWFLIRPYASDRKVQVIAWLGSVFLVYRAGLRAIGFTGYCHCLGSLAQVLHLTDELAEWISLGLLLWMLVPSTLILILNVSALSERASGHIGRSGIERT